MSSESLPLGRGCSVTETGEYLKEAIGRWTGGDLDLGVEGGIQKRRGAESKSTRECCDRVVGWRVQVERKKGRKPVLYTQTKRKI